MKKIICFAPRVPFIFLFFFLHTGTDDIRGVMSELGMPPEMFGMAQVPVCLFKRMCSSLSACVPL
jgi:hypothetical protein